MRGPVPTGYAQSRLGLYCPYGCLLLLCCAGKAPATGLFVHWPAGLVAQKDPMVYTA